MVKPLFRKFLLNKRFLDILPPKLIVGTTSQGRASQFYNQMEICGDLERVFVVAPVFKAAEGSYTCEDACLDVKMEIMESYSEVMDILDSIFVEMFDTLNETCQKELDTIGKQALEIRPFFTMPSYGEGAYSNSFDVYRRGEKIIFGSQRIHVPELLESRAKECGIDVKTISEYIEAFRYCAPPHGGFGAGLERILMLFCCCDNIRQTSLFPGDPRWLES
ncbi:hypothetical protein CTI12_AA417030 [Artemisia annua]|uniref:Aminoacyl-tRNA synthetase class II (D/K/N) domain-containing protein n=1 Tax=Artemisia annua TaxID=35608 RepID=A0A2U1M635_ARTAN|nr:hypothetical protein CTI12_AA417030 [Artemisia annua]